MYTPDICIYHGNCDDGFTAAWAIWKRWPQCEFVPGTYGKPLPMSDDIRGKHILFVDFSGKRQQIDEMAQDAASIVIIDHHKTAEADLEPWKVPVVNDEDAFELLTMGAAKVSAWFDMEQSGAVMAIKFAHPGRAIPEGVEYVQDRDLWRFAFGDRTKRFSAALRTYPMDFNIWTTLIYQPSQLVSDGEAILRAHNANIKKFIAEVYDHKIGEHAVPVVNVPYHYASDVAHALLQEYPHAPFAACWFHRGDGMVQWSLRSEDSRVDVSEVARAFGGGGHRNAAGFQEKT